MKTEAFRQNGKEKILKFKELSFPDTFSNKFPQIALKFPSHSSLFLLYKITFKNFIVCVNFSNQYPNKKTAKLTVWLTVCNYTLKPPKNITRLNNKFGFSSILFISILL